MIMHFRISKQRKTRHTTKQTHNPISHLIDTNRREVTDEHKCFWMIHISQCIFLSLTANHHLHPPPHPLNVSHDPWERWRGWGWEGIAAIEQCREHTHTHNSAVRAALCQAEEECAEVISVHSRLADQSKESVRGAVPLIELLSNRF